MTRISAPLALSLAAAVGLAGCSSSGGSGRGAPSTASPAPRTAATTAASSAAGTSAPAQSSPAAAIPAAGRQATIAICSVTLNAAKLFKAGEVANARTAVKGEQALRTTVQDRTIVVEADAVAKAVTDGDAGQVEITSGVLARACHAATGGPFTN